MCQDHRDHPIFRQTVLCSSPSVGDLEQTGLPKDEAQCSLYEDIAVSSSLPHTTVSTRVLPTIWRTWSRSRGYTQLSGSLTRLWRFVEWLPGLPAGQIPITRRVLSQQGGTCSLQSASAFFAHRGLDHTWQTFSLLTASLNQDFEDSFVPVVLMEILLYRSGCTKNSAKHIGLFQHHRF
jgi:hypothetical protein